MSAELWQQAKHALAEVMELTDDERENFLGELQEKSPEVHAEVISLLAAQETAEQRGFLEETYDQYRTLDFDPERTNEQPSTVDFTPPKPSNNLVGEDYELEKKIGQGGMGVVYKAYHRSLRRMVALKIITGGGLRDDVDIARFHIEAEAAARLDHPGIIPVYDVGEHNGNHYYAMAYVEGPSLAEYVGSKTEPLEPRRSAELMEQVCRAVHYAHDRAVIHRDLKPANIMLENGEVPRLADFGLAKDMHSDDGLTMTGQVMGTPSYMAPEQATGKLDQISNRTDVYSLGATLYALLAGKPPFAGATLLETIRKVVRAAPESLKEAEHVVPRDLQIISEKCLAKKPEDRYASAGEVADDLRRYLDGYAISARPLGPMARSWRWCQRNPLVASLLVGIAMTLLVGIIVSTSFGVQANRALAKESLALAEAKQNAKNLRSAMKDTFVFASEDVLAQEPGMQRARAVLLETAQKYYAELVEQAPHDVESQLEMADAQFMLSKIQMAMGRDAEARAALQKGLEVQQVLAEKMPGDAALLTALAKTHNQLAKWSQKSWQSLMQLHDVGKLPPERAEEADRQLEDWKRHSLEVIRLRKEVVALQPEDVESKRLLANAMMNEGIAMSIRGFSQKSLIEQDEARKQILQAQEVRMATLQQSAEAHLVRRDLGRGYYNMANIELRAADQEREEESIRSRWSISAEDLTLAIQAYAELPSEELTLNNRLELASCYRERAGAYHRLVELDLAVEDYREAEKLLRVLVMRNPQVYRYRVELAETQLNLSSLWFLKNEKERCAIQLAVSRETLLEALRVDPTNSHAAEQIILYTQTLVDAFLDPRKQDFDMAERLIQAAMQELLALQKESEEYAELDTWIEKLKESASRVQEQREAAENPDDVA